MKMKKITAFLLCASIAASQGCASTKGTDDAPKSATPLICPVYYYMEGYQRKPVMDENGMVCSDGKVYCYGPGQEPIPEPEDREGYVCTENRYGVLEYIQTAGFGTAQKGSAEFYEDGDSWYLYSYPHCTDSNRHFGAVHPQVPEDMRVWDCLQSAQDAGCVCGGTPCNGACIRETCIDRSRQLEPPPEPYCDDDCKEGFSANAPKMSSNVRYGANLEDYDFEPDFDARLYCADLYNYHGNYWMEDYYTKEYVRDEDGEVLEKWGDPVIVDVFPPEKAQNSDEENAKVNEVPPPMLPCGKRWFRAESSVSCIPNPSGEDIVVFESCPILAWDPTLGQNGDSGKDVALLLAGLSRERQAEYLDLEDAAAEIEAEYGDLSHDYEVCVDKPAPDGDDEYFWNCASWCGSGRDRKAFLEIPREQRIATARVAIREKMEKQEKYRELQRAVLAGKATPGMPYTQKARKPRWDARLQNCFCEDELCAPGTGCLDGHCVDLATLTTLPEGFVWWGGRPYCDGETCLCGAEACHRGEWCIVDKCFDSPEVMKIDVDIPGVVTVRDKYMRYGKYEYTGHDSSFFDGQRDEPLPRDEYLPIDPIVWMDIRLHRYAAMCTEPDMLENLSDYLCIAVEVDNGCYEAPQDAYSYRGYHCIREEGCACGDTTCPKHGRCYHGACIFDEVYIAMACSADFNQWGHGEGIWADANGWCHCGASVVPPYMSGYVCEAPEYHYPIIEFTGMRCGLHAGCACGDATCARDEYCLRPGTCASLEDTRTTKTWDEHERESKAEKEEIIVNRE